MSTYQAIQRLAIVAVVVLAIWHLFGLFAPILAPFAAALVIAYVLDPAASAIERIGVHRGLAALAMIVALILGMLLFALLMHLRVRLEDQKAALDELYLAEEP